VVEHIDAGQSTGRDGTSGVPRLVNNRSVKIVDLLIAALSSTANVSVVSQTFSVFAFDALEKHLRRTKSFRLLLPANEPAGSDDEFHVPELTGDDGDRSYRNKLALSATARACADWISRQVQIRSIGQKVPQNLLHVESAAPVSITGSSQLTTSGLQGNRTSVLCLTV